MKQFYLTKIFVAAVLLTACNKEEKFMSLPPEGVLRATIESSVPSTRAGFTNGGTFFWSANDQIGVTTSKAPTSFSVLELDQNSIGKASGNFAGNVIGTIEGYAVYPFNSAHSFDGTTLTYRFKSEYIYTHVDADYTTTIQGEGNSFNPPMWGKIEGEGVSLKHLGGVLCIKISELPQGEDLQIILTSDKKINGTYTVALNTQKPAIEAVPVENSAEKTVTIKFSNSTNTSGVFYFPVPAGDHTLRLKVLNNSTEIINAALGTYKIERCALKKLELNKGSMNAGVQSIAQSAEEVKNKLATADDVVLTNGISGNNIIEIPKGSTDNSSKAVTFEKIDASTLTVQDDAIGSGTPVKNLTLSFAKNETQLEKLALTLNTPNTTSILQATAGDFAFGTVTGTTADNTLVVGKGVSIEKLIVCKGNVRVKTGATIKALERGAENIAIVTVIREEQAILPELISENFKVISAAEYDLKMAAKEGGTINLAADVTLSSPLVVEKDLVLDLNGHDILPQTGALTPVTGIVTVDAMVLVRRGATLTIEGQGNIDGENNETLGATIKLTDKNDETNDAINTKAAKLIVKGGTIKSKYFAISGNGNRDNTELEIIGGTISSLSDYAIYSPQNGTTIISGGTITGAGGAITLQEGTLTISGNAILTSLGTMQYDNQAGDGTRKLNNAAVCVPARYGSCNVNISGGTFVAQKNAKTFDLEYDKQENSQTTINITGGAFSDKCVEKHLSANFILEEIDNSKFEVVTKQE